MKWSVAYAKQARSDLMAREALTRTQLPDCHQLHFLQMACEKLSKAHLRRQGSSVEDLRSSHAYIAKQLPSIIRQIVSRDARKMPKNTWLVRAVGKLARQIELLAPAVTDAGGSPSNCEYPWLGPSGNVIVPAEHNFNITLLHENAGRQFLKLIQVAIDELAAAAPE